MSKTTINIKQLVVNLSIAKPANALDGLIHAVLSAKPIDFPVDAPAATPGAPADAPVATPAAAPSDAGVTTHQALGSFNADDWDTLSEGDTVTAFDSSKNTLQAGNSADVVEVDDDYVRINGVFTSKGDKGTRRVTLKIAKSEVADGSVKFSIAD